MPYLNWWWVSHRHSPPWSPSRCKCRWLWSWGKVPAVSGKQYAKQHWVQANLQMIFQELFHAKIGKYNEINVTWMGFKLMEISSWVVICLDLLVPFLELKKRHVDRGPRPCSTTSYKDHSINGSSHLSDELAGRIMPKKAYSYVACWSAKSASQVSVKKCCPSALQYTSS